MATISHVVRIKAPTTAIVDAVTKDDAVRTWFTPHVDGSIEKGGPARFSFADGKTFEWRVESVEPGKVVWTCVSGPGQAPGSSLTFDLTGLDGGQTRVGLEHADWPEDHDALATCNTLWGYLLVRLKLSVEGAGVEFP